MNIGEWVHSPTHGRLHGFVAERGEWGYYKLYLPHPNPGWRVYTVHEAHTKPPERPPSDEDWAKFVAFQLTGKQ